MRNYRPFFLASFFLSGLLFLTILSSCGDPTGGCAKDQDCKGERICQNNVCVDPQGTEKKAEGSSETTSETTGEMTEGTQEALPDSAEKPGPEEAAPTERPPTEGPAKEREPLPEPPPEPIQDLDPTPCQSGQQRACYTGEPSTLNIGECQAGLEVCTDSRWGACTGQKTPSPEICDNKDNDCDGKIDEAVNRPCFTGNPAVQGVGECKDGSQVCVNGLWGTCQGQTLPIQERCDGKDNDCDGQIDNGLPTPACVVPQALGICATGLRRCIQGAEVCVGQQTPQVEVCNQLDDNCDGKIDEGLSCVPPCLSFTPASIDFGSVQINCGSGKKTISVQSACASLHQILQVGLTGTTGPEFRNDPPSRALPATIAPAQPLSVAVEFRPTSAGTFQGALQFNLPAASGNFFQIPLKGIARATAQNTDTFAYNPGSNKTDILFVIDDSCSMASSQTTIANNASTFFTRLTQNAVDYQIAIVTTDTLKTPKAVFRGNPPILTPATQNAASLFASAIRVGTAGSTDEKGLEAAYLALTPPNSTGANQGFLRADSNLLLLFISDEPDTSPQTVAFYIQAFQGLKAPPSQVQVGALTLPCTGTPCGDRYGQVWQALGGIHLALTPTVGGTPNASNAASFMTQAADLAKTSLPSFALSQKPDVASLSVKVNGNLVSQSAVDGWVYDAVANRIRLVGTAAPAQGATIEISYLSPCLP